MRRLRVLSGLQIPAPSVGRIRRLRRIRQRIREAEETKNNLMQVASEHIAPLQDAADLEIATEEETSLLEAWKKYRVLLNRVDTSTAPDIEWPTNPVRE